MAGNLYSKTIDFYRITSLYKKLVIAGFMFAMQQDWYRVKIGRDKLHSKTF